MSKFWLVWVDGTRGATFKHPNVQEASNEAERLALLPENAGKQVYILEAISACAKNIVTWTTLVDINNGQDLQEFDH